MKTLEEKFRLVFENLQIDGHNTNYLKEADINIAAKQCVQIAEDFAISFAEWRHDLFVSNDIKYAQNSSKSLLDIYKQQLKTF